MGKRSTPNNELRPQLRANAPPVTQRMRLAGTPRWAYAFGIGFVAVLVLLFLIQHLYFGMGNHAR